MRWGEVENCRIRVGDRCHAASLSVPSEIMPGKQKVCAAGLEVKHMQKVRSIGEGHTSIHM